MSFISGTRGVLIFFLVNAAIMLFHLYLATKGKKFPIRRIAGLDAIEEAVGRCTEMGKPCFFTLGSNRAVLVGDMATQTVAGISILGYIARLTAKQDTTLRCFLMNTESYPLMADTVSSSYAAEGKADKYNPNDMFIWAVGGTTQKIAGEIGRQRPGAHFIMGPAGGESIMFTEIGAQVGAIQVAASARQISIAHLVFTCDYVLLMEELFAAGAYVSNDATQICFLRAQDIGRFILLGLLVIGVVLQAAGSKAMVNFLTW